MVARLRRSRFTRSVAILAGGAAAAQIINAVVAPIVTRLFSPVEVGQLGIFLAFLQVAAIALSLRYEQGIVVPSSEAVAARVVVLSLAAIPVVSLLGAIALWGLMEMAWGGYGTLPSVAAPLGFLALLAAGIITVLRFWAIRLDRYRLASEVIVLQSAIRGLGQVLAGFVAAGVVGLLATDVAARAAGVVSLLRATMPTILRARREPAASLRETARTYWQFPVYGLPSALVNTAATAMAVPLVAAAYGLEAAGFLSLVQRVLGVPLAVIGGSVGDAFLARTSEYARATPGLALPFFRRTALALALLGLPVGVVLAVTGPELFAVVFGASWREAGAIAAAMAPWLVVTLVVSPLSRVAVVYRGQGQKLVYDGLLLGAIVGGVAWGSANAYDATRTIGLVAWLQVGASLVYLLLLYGLVRRGRFEHDPDPA